MSSRKIDLGSHSKGIIFHAFPKRFFFVEMTKSKSLRGKENWRGIDMGIRLMKDRNVKLEIERRRF